MTQPTDEAAVDIMERLRDGDDLKTRMEAADEIRRLYMLAKANNLLARRHADEIETLRAQLTAATRRAEQAERMLAEVDALFNENINKQADRLGISPDKVESPGQWMMRVRRAAINALKGTRP